MDEVREIPQLGRHWVILCLHRQMVNGQLTVSANKAFRNSVFAHTKRLLVILRRNSYFLFLKPAKRL